MTYSKKFQSKKVLVANVTKIVEAAEYKEIDTEKEGIEVLYFDDIVEGVKFTYMNAAGSIASTTFKRSNNYNGAFDYLVVNHLNQNLSDYLIVLLTKAMLKRYAKK